MAMALIINKVLMDMALRRQSRSTSTFKEEYWYSTFLKVVPFYDCAKLLRAPQQSDAPGHHDGTVRVGEEHCQREQEGGTSGEKEKERSPMDPSTRGTDTLEMMPRMLKRAVVFVIARKDERVCVCVFQYKVRLGIKDAHTPG